MSIKRLLNLESLIQKKSFFLFGPRATGKTTLIKETLREPNYQLINLLNSDMRLKLLQRPSLLPELLEPGKKGYIIDEIQKIPELLDEVHSLIQEKKYHFLLTGSSARKLRRGHANLLAGRARTAHFFPLCYPEISSFDLMKRLTIGGLPEVFLSEDPYDDLKAYIDTYLKEEIMAEGLVRNIGGFARFLTVSAQMSGQLLNYAAVGSDAMVSESTVRGYYQILSDTLLGEALEPWVQSKKRKAIQTVKFYLFDTGVTHALLDIRQLSEKTDAFGKAFEAWIYSEIKAYLSYRRKHERLTYWRSVSDHEVDFCIGETVAIEAKAKRNTAERDLSGLRALAEEKIFKKYILVSLDPIESRNDGIFRMHWKKFIERLWNDEIT